MNCAEWLETQRMNGGPHGFECIGIARMTQVWEAAQESIQIPEGCKRILKGLWQYGNVHPVYGVIYPEGTHAKLLREAAAMLASYPEE